MFRVVRASQCCRMTHLFAMASCDIAASEPPCSALVHKRLTKAARRAVSPTLSSSSMAAAVCASNAGVVAVTLCWPRLSCTSEQHNTALSQRQIARNGMLTSLNIVPNNQNVQ